MTQLAIRVRGEVLSSNFDEWKIDLISKIQAVNTELSTDAQFAQAESDVKSFKSAESALKKAKESAINQVSDIQRLFSAIDEVSAEVRQVRLSLERQIKQRKAEIKEEFVNLGIATVRKYIELQGPEFQRIDHSDYLARGAFISAMKYRSNIRALQGAIDDACAQIKSQVDERAVLVMNNAVKLDSLPVAHQALFQDRGILLALSAGQLDDIIDKRINVFEQQTRVGGSKEDTEAEGPVEDYQPEGNVLAPEDKDDDKSTYTVTIELSATIKEAEEFLRRLRSDFSGNPIIRTFQLERL